MLAEATSTASTDQSGSGLFLLAWGVFASGLGLGLVTNFRGFADRFAQMNRASNAWLMRIPPWKWMPVKPDSLVWRARLSRIIAIPFAILGPIVTIAGVAQILHGHISMSRGPALPLPLGILFVAAALVSMGQFWRRGMMLRLAAQQGGWMRAAAVVATAGTLGFGGFFALGQWTLGIASWLVAAVAMLSLMMSRKSVFGPPQDAADRP